MKVEIPIQRANRLINHGCVILVTSKYKDKQNIITLAWQTPVSHKPKLVAICIHKSHFSHDLIKKGGEFVINVPTVEILKEVHFCGTNSGKDIDKFKETGFTPMPAKKVKSPLIKECIAHLECASEKIYDCGDHSLFLAEVIYAQAEKGIFDNFLNIEKVKTLHHLGANLYTTPDKIIKA
jgi:flavin reductase (DIM6/NTAB) family NADH-FMN oxidoreductase RutF